MLTTIPLELFDLILYYLDESDHRNISQASSALRAVLLPRKWEHILFDFCEQEEISRGDADAIYCSTTTTESRWFTVVGFANVAEFYTAWKSGSLSLRPEYVRHVSILVGRAFELGCEMDRTVLEKKHNDKSEVSMWQAVELLLGLLVPQLLHVVRLDLYMGRCSELDFRSKLIALTPNAQVYLSADLCNSAFLVKLLRDLAQIKLKSLWVGSEAEHLNEDELEELRHMEIPDTLNSLRMDNCKSLTAELILAQLPLTIKSLSLGPLSAGTTLESVAVDLPNDIESLEVIDQDASSARTFDKAFLDLRSLKVETVNGRFFEAYAVNVEHLHLISVTPQLESKRNFTSLKLFYPALKSLEVESLTLDSIFKLDFGAIESLVIRDIITLGGTKWFGNYLAQFTKNFKHLKLLYIEFLPVQLEGDELRTILGHFIRRRKNMELYFAFQSGQHAILSLTAEVVNSSSFARVTSRAIATPFGLVRRRLKSAPVALKFLPEHFYD